MTTAQRFPGPRRIIRQIFLENPVPERNDQTALAMGARGNSPTRRQNGRAGVAQKPDGIQFAPCRRLLAAGQYLGSQAGDARHDLKRPQLQQDIAAKRERFHLLDGQIVFL